MKGAEIRAARDAVLFADPHRSRATLGTRMDARVTGLPPNRTFRNHTMPPQSPPVQSKSPTRGRSPVRLLLQAPDCSRSGDPCSGGTVIQHATQCSPIPPPRAYADPLPRFRQRHYESPALIALEDVVSRDGAASVGGPVLEGRGYAHEVLDHELDPHMSQIFVGGCFSRVIAHREIEPLPGRQQVRVAGDRTRERPAAGRSAVRRALKVHVRW